MNIYIYIYICREREISRMLCVCIYIYIYMYIHTYSYLVTICKHSSCDGPRPRRPKGACEDVADFPYSSFDYNYNYIYIYIYIYVYVHIHMCIYIYIYISIEREREMCCCLCVLFVVMLFRRRGSDPQKSLLALPSVTESQIGFGDKVRPISALRFWISEGLPQA